MNSQTIRLHRAAAASLLIAHTHTDRRQDEGLRGRGEGEEGDADNKDFQNAEV